MLSIFQTKKVEYNKLILKCLVNGAKTTTQIAEYIYFNRKQKPKLRLHPKKVKEPDKNKIKSIVSIISRKKSRLKELETKYYIQKKNDLWYLTSPKGYAVAITLFNSVTEIYPYIPIEDLSEMFRRLHEIPIIDAFLNDERLRKIEDLSKSSQFLQYMKDCTNELINEGINIDKMSLEEFNVILSGKIAYILLKQLQVSWLKQ